MNRTFTLLIRGVATLALLFIIDWMVFWNQPLNFSSPRSVIIAEGQSIKAAAYQINKQLPFSRPAYFFWTFILKTKTIQHGHYLIYPKNTPKACLRKFHRAATEYERFVLQSGWRWQQLEAALNQHPGVKKTLTSVEECTTFALELSVSTLEGIFAPDTYFFKSGIHDKELLKLAFNEQNQRIKKLNFNEASLRSPMDVLTLASIIEREGSTHEDYKIISGVFHNRLRIHMPLQSDATVNYGRTALRSLLTLKDLSLKHTHNTYRIKGLPPTPIAYPSEHAMIAAVYPAESEYLFFLTDRYGKLVCSREFKDHIHAKKNI